MVENFGCSNLEAPKLLLQSSACRRHKGLRLCMLAVQVPPGAIMAIQAAPFGVVRDVFPRNQVNLRAIDIDLFNISTAGVSGLPWLLCLSAPLLKGMHAHVVPDLYLNFGMAGAWAGLGDGLAGDELCMFHISSPSRIV